ncbi:MAG TPA: hypothetical protein VKA69_02015, partial [Desulfobacteria bacterium]|nr:hypothetical protein [Desulfobacteria bacterium]
MAHDADQTFGWKDCVGCAHFIVFCVATFTKIALVCVLEIMVCQTYGHFAGIGVGQANLIGFFVKVNKFGNTVAGLTPYPQVGCMNFTGAIVKGMTFCALCPRGRLVGGFRHVRV